MCIASSALCAFIMALLTEIKCYYYEWCYIYIYTYIINNFVCRQYITGAPCITRYKWYMTWYVHNIKLNTMLTLTEASGPADARVVRRKNLGGDSGNANEVNTVSTWRHFNNGRSVKKRLFWWGGGPAKRWTHGVRAGINLAWNHVS